MTIAQKSKVNLIFFIFSFLKYCIFQHSYGMETKEVIPNSSIIQVFENGDLSRFIFDIVLNNASINSKEDYKVDSLPQVNKKLYKNLLLIGENPRIINKKNQLKIQLIQATHQLSNMKLGDTINCFEKIVNDEFDEGVVHICPNNFLVQRSDLFFYNKVKGILWLLTTRAELINFFHDSKLKLDTNNPFGLSKMLNKNIKMPADSLFVLWRYAGFDDVFKLQYKIGEFGSLKNQKNKNLYDFYTSARCNWRCVDNSTHSEVAHDLWMYFWTQLILK